MEVKNMIFLTQMELQKLSFPDSEVKDMKINSIQKLMEIDADSCYLDLNGGKRLFNCKVQLRNWRNLEILLYESSAEELKILEPDSAEMLVDICEFVYGEKIIFKGFGKKTGQWIEYDFIGGEFTVSYED
jgi:hypothetical protein